LLPEALSVDNSSSSSVAQAVVARDGDPYGEPDHGPDGPRGRPSRWRRWLFGPPRRLDDKSIFHKLSLVALLAWVGLGADGLSSSAYGPEEAFRALGSHTYLAIALAGVMAMTVFVIAFAYSRVIEHFPSGGGGYVVASKLLGARAGIVSGSALAVDYVLTIAISIAAAGDALFSFIPISWHGVKLPVEAGMIVFLIVLNLRGLRESVLLLTPIFVFFVVTHVVLIGGGLIGHWSQLSATLATARQDFNTGIGTLGIGGMIALFVRAYSLGGGTYTGIEAVSNGLTAFREPRVRTGKRTMAYMAISLAFTASGLLLLYLLWGVGSVPGKTMNAVLAERLTADFPLGQTFVIMVLVAEGALLVVAAQAGFVDGPRVLANMAVDSWVPRRFAALSDRLTAQNGILLMGATAVLTLVLTGGDVRYLVVMYSINVFLTFSMTELSMCRMWIKERKTRRDWSRKILIHAVGLVLCSTILCVTVFEKFVEGGWITLVVTSGFVLLCFVVRRHYRTVESRVARAFGSLEKLSAGATTPMIAEPDRSKPTAVVLVSGYTGFGIHTTLNVTRAFPGHFQSFVFASVGVVDSGRFKGADSVDQLRQETEQMLQKYVAAARAIGVPATSTMAVGTDAVDEAERLCLGIAAEYPRSTFFLGQIVFRREAWYHRLLHNQTALAIQRRLQLAGQHCMVLPAQA
jgi:amino acid transporter